MFIFCAFCARKSHLVMTFIAILCSLHRTCSRQGLAKHSGLGILVSTGSEMKE